MKKKYIIALDDRNVWTCGLPAKTLLLSDVSIFGTDLSSVNTGIELTPYTEPDTDEAYRRGYETAKHECEDCRKIRADAEQELADKAYQSGLSDAWEAAKKIGCYEIDGGYPVTQMLDLFDRDDLPKIMSDYTASEAIEKIRQYEQEKDRQARIEYNFDEIKDVLNTTMKECNVSLDEIAAVLAKMKENNDNK